MILRNSTGQPVEAVKTLLSSITKDGIDGEYPLYIAREGHWHDAYALFVIDWENPAACNKFAKLIRAKFKDCEVNIREDEVEIISHDFDDVDDFYYDYYLIDELW